MIGEGLFKVFLAIKDVANQDIQAEIGKVGIGFPALSSQGLELVGQLDFDPLGLKEGSESIILSTEG